MKDKTTGTTTTVIRTRATRVRTITGRLRVRTWVVVTDMEEVVCLEVADAQAQIHQVAVVACLEGADVLQQTSGHQVVAVGYVEVDAQRRMTATAVGAEECRGEVDVRRQIAARLVVVVGYAAAGWSIKPADLRRIHYK